MHAPRLLPVFWLVSLALAPAARADTRTDLARAYVRSYGSSAVSRMHASVPSFSRQTGLACSACHYQFLALNSFGRAFKLNGYTFMSQQPINETQKGKEKSLHLNPIPLLSGMMIASFTQTKEALPDAQNGSAALPQQLSGFLAGAISSKIGMFTQFTYSGADGSFGIDNIDIRYADKKTIGQSTNIVYGVTLHNNPTVQDVWNTTPAWGFPFTASETAPTGMASTLLEGALAQQVLGLGAYTLIGDLVYGEFSFYRSAMQGRALADSFAIDRVAPYWRVGLQKDFGHQSLMLGTYGIAANVYPGSVTGAFDQYTDIGVDGTFESKAGSGNLVVRGNYINEKQKLKATFAEGGANNPENTLKSLKFNASWYPALWLGVTGGYFSTSGTTDASRYGEEPVVGSTSGSPETAGFIGQVDFNPWQNTRLGIQYTAYSKFNGLKQGYDGAGRNASANNTLYLLTWVAF